MFVVYFLLSHLPCLGVFNLTDLLLAYYGFQFCVLWVLFVYICFSYFSFFIILLTFSEEMNKDDMELERYEGPGRIWGWGD